MKFLLLLPAFLLAHLSAAFFDGGSRENELLDQEWEAGKCSCTCNCEGAPEVPCDVDLYILLDAAVCVRGIWDEMKFRVNLLAKSLDEENGNLGNIESTRLSVISYAKSAITHISINENLNYYQFSEKLDKINWLNEGSYLNNGLIELERNLNQGYSRNKQVSVLLVTNGKSHKSVGDHEVGTILKRIRDQHNAHLFVNTLVPVQTELEYEDCRVCDFNRDLFIGELDMSVREMDEEFVNLDNGSVISKDDLLSAFVKEYTQMCPDIVDPRYCDDCVCSCAMPEGEDGNNGPRGLDGNDGFQGKDGDDGNDGEPGRCGIEGPDGIFGLNGRDGSPGAHGSSGTAGMTGDNGDKGADGNQGRIGRPGASGRIGKSGEKGKPGVPGPDGDIGPRGDTGEKGLKGPNGNQGDQGDHGDRGEKGDRGEAGPDGKKGPRGPVGPRGAQGSTGEAGDKGRQGNRGPIGHPGRRGKQGEPGRNGKDGLPGVQGIRGNPGPTGRPGRLATLPDEVTVRHNIRQFLARLLPANGRQVSRNCQGYVYGSVEYNRLMQRLFSQNWFERTQSGSVTEEGSSWSVNWNNSNEFENNQTQAPNLNVVDPNIADIVFVVEASQNTLHMNWNKITEWIGQMVASMQTDLFSEVESMVIVVRFDQSVSNTQRRLFQSKLDQLIENTAINAVYSETLNTGEDSYDALSAINANYFPQLRQHSRKILISMTDGLYRHLSNKTDAEKNLILDETNQNFPTMISIGYGSAVNTQELQSWSTHAEDAMLLNSVDELAMTTDLLIEYLRN